MFLKNKQRWHSEELTSTLIMHAMVKMQIQIKVSFFDLDDRIFNDGFTHLRDPTSFFFKTVN